MNTEPAPSSLPTGVGRRETWPRRFGLDLAYVLTGFPVALASFVVLVTLLCLSIGLVIIWVGVPLLVITLLVARGFGEVERGRLRLRGDQVSVVRSPRRAADANVMRSLLGRLRDRQAWLDLLHGIVIFPVATFGWVVAVTWVASTLGGLTFWFWGRFLPEDEYQGLAQLLELDVAEWQVNMLIGVFGAVTLVPVVRLVASAQAGLSRAVLDSAHLAGLHSRVAELTESRAAVTDAEAASMRRLERDIHDGPQQRLVRLGMDLASAERRMGDDPEAARRLIGEARQHTAATLDELRALSRGIAPPVLADRGLAAAVEELASASPVPVTLDIDDLGSGRDDDQVADGRLPARVEAAAYFSVAEALANVAKHATASHVRIGLHPRADPSPRLVVEVHDDGVGGADPAKGHGLAGLRDRLRAVDGTLGIVSPPGGPTTLTAVIPCES